MNSADSFPTTQWTLVVQAGEATDERKLEALEALCRLYHKPVWRFVRSWTDNPHDAEDLVQGFFAELLASDFTAGLSPADGKFRAFLLAAASNYMRKQYRKQRAQRRGGAVASVSIEEVESQVPNHPLPPEVGFDREWAWALMEHALSRLRKEYDAASKPQLFEVLQTALIPGAQSLPLQEMAVRLGLSVGATKVALHRLRKRWKTLLTAEVARTVANKQEVDDELHHLIQVLIQTPHETEPS
jgi:RNA polymerase sigma factor (sigma-70 family)